MTEAPHKGASGQEGSDDEQGRSECHIRGA